ncbi:MAG TPA: deoxyguanosinetriphosphate triphosphohydrolase [Mycobacteriales bacterium]|nr:deoxyguanosinetriphosphate triphosphohydrolase [Mycobacteriales bacterium]
MYDEAARERWVAEAPKRPGRTAFQRDRARVLHSAALRRLAGKTQVVGVGESDFPRTRLTHSLECAQVGRELGIALGCDPDVVDAACLAHDLGHPPFGHNGETALDGAAAGCGGFEGNAQSLRILTRLEAKTFAADGRSAGLNLTRATLDAATKYPWPRPPTGGKHGVYDDDRPVFAWLRAGAPEDRRCLEAQVMDWADDVAYSVHDLEDALHAGHVRLEQLADRAERADVAALTAEVYCDATPSELEEVFAGLIRLPYWPASYDGSLRALAALKNLTSQLIGRFCTLAEHATRKVFGPGPHARYGADLVVPPATRLECALLKGVAARYVMHLPDRQRRQADERDMLRELVAVVAAQAPASLDPALRPLWTEAPDDAARLRVVIDQVAGLTDASARQWHERLTTR